MRDWTPQLQNTSTKTHTCSVVAVPPHVLLPSNIEHIILLPYILSCLIQATSMESESHSVFVHRHTPSNCARKIFVTQVAYHRVNSLAHFLFLLASTNSNFRNLIPTASPPFSVAESRIGVHYLAAQGRLSNCTVTQMRAGPQIHVLI